MIFKVNDKEYSSFDIKTNNKKCTMKNMIQTIIDFAEKERGIEKVKDYNSLSQDEIEFIKQNKKIDLINKFQKLKPEDKNYAIKLAKLKQDVLDVLSSYTENRLISLEREIGKPAKTQSVQNSYEDILKKVLNS